MDIIEYTERLEDFKRTSDLSRSNCNASLEEKEKRIKSLKDQVKKQDGKVAKLEDKIKKLYDGNDGLLEKQYDRITKLHDENYALLEKLHTATQKSLDIDADRKRLRRELDELK